MLGKYNTKVVLPKTKSELARQINSLGQVEIYVLEPVNAKNIGLVKSEIETFVRNDKNLVSIALLKQRWRRPYRLSAYLKINSAQ